MLLENAGVQVGESVNQEVRQPWPSLMTFLTQGPQGISSGWTFTKPVFFLLTVFSSMALTICLKM